MPLGVVAVGGAVDVAVDGTTGSTGPSVFPSTFRLGSGAAPGIPCCDGACALLSAGCVIAGGWFW